MRLPLVFTGSGFRIREHYSNLYHTHGVEFAPTIEMPTLNMQIRTVALGLGYSFVPRSLIRHHLEEGSILAVNLKEEPVFRRTVCLLSADEIPLSRAARAFVDLLLESAERQKDAESVTEKAGRAAQK